MKRGAHVRFVAVRFAEWAVVSGVVSYRCPLDAEVTIRDETRPMDRTGGTR